MSGASLSQLAGSSSTTINENCSVGTGSIDENGTISLFRTVFFTLWFSLAIFSLISLRSWKSAHALPIFWLLLRTIAFSICFSASFVTSAILFTFLGFVLWQLMQYAFITQWVSHTELIQAFGANRGACERFG